MKSLDGTATLAVIPREAMGIGDIHLLGMIGAFFGWAGVFFSLFAASIFAIIAAVIGRIGFGKQLPFGPFLAMGGARPGLSADGNSGHGISISSDRSGCHERLGRLLSNGRDAMGQGASRAAAA